MPAAPRERERESTAGQVPNCSRWMFLKELQSVESPCWNRFILRDGNCGKDHSGAEEECGKEGTAKRTCFWGGLYCLCFSPLF